MTPLIFEPTCAHAQWALMRRLASVSLSVCLIKPLEKKSLEKKSTRKKSCLRNYMGQVQRSHGSRSNVTLVRPSLKVMILAGGLTSTSSCLFKCLHPCVIIILKLTIVNLRIIIMHGCKHLKKC